LPTARPGGKPGPSNTGVPAGTKLKVVSGDQVFSTPNQVISGLDVHGFVQIRAAHVTIRNSIIRGGPNPRCNSAVVWVRADAGASATIQDSEVDPAHPSPCLDGIWAVNATLERMNIHGAVDGVKAYDNVTVEDSYIHDLSWFASDPNQGGGATHNDDVQTYEGNKHIMLRHNTMSPGPKGNATYQVTQDGGKVATDLRIVDNWLDGGGCTLNFSHKGGPTPMTGIYVVNNRFGRHSVFGCPILVSTQTILSQDSGNVWADTGKPIPPPQRHD
jgi:Right handed beta helix region